MAQQKAKSKSEVTHCHSASSA